MPFTAPNTDPPVLLLSLCADLTDLVTRVFRRKIVSADDCVIVVRVRESWERRVCAEAVEVEAKRVLARVVRLSRRIISVVW